MSKKLREYFAKNLLKVLAVSSTGAIILLVANSISALALNIVAILIMMCMIIYLAWTIAKTVDLMIKLIPELKNNNQIENY